jgi:hypothetical protein
MPWCRLTRLPRCHGCPGAKTRIPRHFQRRLATRPGVYLSIGTRHELRIISLESATATGGFPSSGLFNAQAPIERSAAGHAYLGALPPADRELLITALRITTIRKRRNGTWSKPIFRFVFRRVTSTGAVGGHSSCHHAI